jgi:Cu/Zn superoxide dismutase
MPCISMKQQIAHPAATPRPLNLFDKDGSAFIIHDREDTYCPDGDVAGCAGGTRPACGITLPNGNNNQGMTLGSSC